MSSFGRSKDDLGDFLKHDKSLRRHLSPEKRQYIEDKLTKYHENGLNRKEILKVTREMKKNLDDPIDKPTANRFKREALKAMREMNEISREHPSDETNLSRLNKELNDPEL